MDDFYVEVSGRGTILSQGDDLAHFCRTYATFIDPNGVRFRGWCQANRPGLSGTRCSCLTPGEGYLPGTRVSPAAPR